jgi:hypothetical protein
LFGPIRSRPQSTRTYKGRVLESSRGTQTVVEVAERVLAEEIRKNLQETRGDRAYRMAIQNRCQVSRRMFIKQTVGLESVEVCLSEEKWRH